MDAQQIASLVAGGLVGGIVNTLAGGGSLITVPLLVLLGLPGMLANGTNRVGVLLQSLVGVWRFHAEGVSELRAALPLLAPVAAGAVLGASAITRVSDTIFEQLFGGVMLLLLVPLLRETRRTGSAASAVDRPTPAPVTSGAPGWPTATRALVFFAIGFYGGAIQAGAGIIVLFALTRAGLDLVRANALKMVVMTVLAAVAVPVFVIEGSVVWWPALLVSIGFMTGAALGARIAVRGGERVIRPVLTVAVVVLAGRMLGLY